MVCDWAGGARPIFWQGPSIGFDLGGKASKVFTLVYHLKSADDMHQVTDEYHRGRRDSVAGGPAAQGAT